MIPINIDELLDGTIIEDNRIEFKSDWNPEKVLHTICAFANDYDNIGGGYIVVGVAEIDGRPIDYKGFDPKTLPAVERELSELCNLISPRYVPSISLEKYHGMDLLVIWVPGGEMRPYKCPVSLGKRKTDGGEGAYYIRNLSHTVRANRDEEISLIRRANRILINNISFSIMHNLFPPFNLNSIYISFFKMCFLCLAFSVIQITFIHIHPSASFFGKHY